MRSQIAITRGGITKASTGKVPPEGGVLARRVNGSFTVSLHRKVSEKALVQLLRSLRALDPEFRMTLETTDRRHEDMTRRQACHRIALQAIGIIERANEALFMSNIELFSDLRAPSMLQSENLLKLASLELADHDAPSALMQASAADIDNLVSVGQNRSMRLYYLAIPPEHVWPSPGPTPGTPLEDIAGSPPWRWLSIIYETALAVQAPLFQHGFLRLHGGTMRPFQRFIYPITPAGERPSNYRVLTTAELLESPDLVII
ncbi:MAG: hypothetical protein EBT94_07295 [Alphaproteobacteria bacterium]|jgi:hypothetical protein|nr:hypothetical protein [Alphaproteobacteria bacterium]